MTVVPLKPARIELWSGTLRGESFPRWFAERIDAGDDDGVIVSDYATKEEALADSRDWDLPIFVKR